MKSVRWVYSLFAIAMLFGLFLTIQFELTDDALISIQAGKVIFFVAATLAIVFCVSIGMLLRPHRSMLLGIIAPLSATATELFGPASMYPLIVLIVGLIATLFVWENPAHRPSQKIISVCVLLVPLGLAAFWSYESYYYNNRTGADNPYTQDCIDAGYKTAKGDYCAN